MRTDIKNYILPFYLLFLLSSPGLLHAQKTQIRGFVDFNTSIEPKKTSFSLGEQDLFITSELGDHVSFLGESVFRYSPESPTRFNVSIERVIIKYNYFGNHSLLFGKHHTPVNYWNDTYHHGRVFFPTINRPLVFSEGLLPLHTTGISLQGQNLGKYKFGYDFMVGNGLASNDIIDNDLKKSITAAVHIKPIDGLRIGASYYSDEIAKGTHMHDRNGSLNFGLKQKLATASVAYFGKFELLSEATFAFNRTDTTGSKTTNAAYMYAGYRVKEKWIPYIRIDNVNYQNGEVYFHKNNKTSLIAGLRFEVNFLTVVKLEYQHDESETVRKFDKLTAQFAIGF